ncbi:MAG: DNA-directed RNA polymerase subunit delta [Mollicutes bacterium]|nr:DNA-directed RNA polymerase subunit delta [Mollicutes bacterium]
MTNVLSNEELETMNYSELAELILKEEKRKMKIVDIFKTICKIKNLSDDVFETKISDFFELISTDKRFIILEQGFCDLKIKHTPNVLIEDEEDLLELDTNILTDDFDEDEGDIYYDSSSDDDDITDDDSDGLEGLYVIDEDETNS